MRKTTEKAGMATHPMPTHPNNHSSILQAGHTVRQSMATGGGAADDYVYCCAHDCAGFKDTAENVAQTNYCCSGCGQLMHFECGKRKDAENIYCSKRCWDGGDDVEDFPGDEGDREEEEEEEVEEVEDGGSEDEVERVGEERPLNVGDGGHGEADQCAAGVNCFVPGDIHSKLDNDSSCCGKACHLVCVAAPCATCIRAPESSGHGGLKGTGQLVCW